MISLCFATRKRPVLFKEMCLSALNTAADPNDIEFVSYHDNDDKTAYEYFGNHKEIVGERIFLHQMANACQQIATGPIYWFGGDDHVFETPDWDKRVKEVFDSYPDKIVLVCLNNGTWDIWKFGTEGFVHANWIKALGYFLNPHPHGASADKWINEVAVGIGRQVYLEDVVKKHLGIKDRVHWEKGHRGREWHKEYFFPEMIEARKKEIAILQEYIKNHGT